MTREGIQQRLEELTPIRQTEFAVMSGYSVPTLRRLLSEGSIRGVRLTGTGNWRVPVDEARRILVDLHVLPEQHVEAR